MRALAPSYQVKACMQAGVHVLWYGNTSPGDRTAHAQRLVDEAVCLLLGFMAAGALSVAWPPSSC